MQQAASREKLLKICVKFARRVSDWRITRASIAFTMYWTFYPAMLIDTTLADIMSIARQPKRVLLEFYLLTCSAFRKFDVNI